MIKEHLIVRLLSASTKVELALSGSSSEFSQSRLSGVKEGSRQHRRLRQNELNMNHMSLPHELQLQPRAVVSRRHVTMMNKCQCKCEHEIKFKFVPDCSPHQ